MSILPNCMAVLVAFVHFISNIELQIDYRGRANTAPQMELFMWWLAASGVQTNRLLFLNGFESCFQIIATPHQGGEQCVPSSWCIAKNGAFFVDQLSHYKSQICVHIQADIAEVSSGFMCAKLHHDYDWLYGILQR